MSRRENEISLIKGIVTGLSGWATYQQSCGARQSYSEYFFYPPISLIAKSRNWIPIQQEKILKSNSLPGANSTIDFAFYRHQTHMGSYKIKYDGLIFMEVKFLRGNNPGSEIKSIKQDMDKIRNLTNLSTYNSRKFPDCNTSCKVMLIVTQRRFIEKIFKTNIQNNHKTQGMIAYGYHINIPSTYISFPITHQDAGHDWIIMAFISTIWPF